MFRVNQSNSEAQSAIRDFQRFFRDSSTPEKTCTTISMEIFDLRWKVELRNTNYSSRGDGKENQSQIISDTVQRNTDGYDSWSKRPSGIALLFFSGQGPDIPPFFGGEKVEGRSQIRGILFTRRQLPDHDRTMTESLPNTHLKDRISSMSLFIPDRVYLN